jgi:hypothetical protein
MVVLLLSRTAVDAGSRQAPREKFRPPQGTPVLLATMSDQLRKRNMKSEWGRAIFAKALRIFAEF